MMGCRSSYSCRKLFFNIEIFPVHIYHDKKNRNNFVVNSEIYHIDSRQHANFHQPSVNLTRYQKGVYYSGV